MLALQKLARPLPSQVHGHKAIKLLFEKCPRGSSSFRTPTRKEFPRVQLSGHWEVSVAMVLLLLAADLGVLHMVLVCRHAVCKSYGVRRWPPRFQKKAWKVRECAPEMAVCAVVTVKPKVQWRLQELGDAGT